MAFKLNIGEKTGKTWKVELESEEFIDRKLGEVIEGKIISPDLEGYQFEITGTSDKSGFTSMKNVEGIGLKRILLTYGKGMKKKPRKEGKKKIGNQTPNGLRLRKTVRGNTISEATVQINLKVVQAGKTPLVKIYGPKEEVKEETQ